MPDILAQKISYAICAETCAFKGEPPCYTVASDPPPECDEPGCAALAAAVVARLRSDPEIDWMRWKRGELIEAPAKERGITRERMRMRIKKVDKAMAYLSPAAEGQSQSDGSGNKPR